jgi:hypothetical protein
MNKKLLNRADFLKNIIRIIMGSLLAFIAIALGRKISTLNDCSSCPGQGICRGESDCSRFLAEKK